MGVGRTRCRGCCVRGTHHIQSRAHVRPGFAHVSPSRARFLAIPREDGIKIVLRFHKDRAQLAAVFRG